MAKKIYEESNIQNIADAIRKKNGTNNSYKPSEMAAAITAITTSGGGEVSEPSSDFIVTGDCTQRFDGDNGWDWFIENYGNWIITENVTNATGMFKSTTVEVIPFEINCFDGINIPMSNMFIEAKNLTSIPKINGCCPDNMAHLFKVARRLRYLPEDIENWFDWSSIELNRGETYGSRDGTFGNCSSLRKIPMGFMSYGNPYARYDKSIFYEMCQNCYALDEIVDLPNPHLNAIWDNNALLFIANYCHRLKNFTFKMPNDKPYTVKWKNQVLDLSSFVGYAFGVSYITDYNSGITTEKRVTDDASYQALKDDPDWWTTDIAYSRYNHDSAVATINSLPDASAYIKANGGTNTIKFKGASGSKTDGGAISNLTAEEIAVAEAKGWTVEIV